MGSFGSLGGAGSSGNIRKSTQLGKGRNSSIGSKKDLELDDDKTTEKPFEKELRLIKTIFAMADEMDIVDFDQLNQKNTKSNSTLDNNTVNGQSLPADDIELKEEDDESLFTKPLQELMDDFADRFSDDNWIARTVGGHDVSDIGIN
jgi:hypothetical protein